VSLGPDKKKRVLPKLSPGNDQENMRRYAQALERRQLRLERRKLIEDTFKSLLTRIRSTSDIEPPPPLVEVEKKDEKVRIGMVAELDGKDHTDQKKQRGGGGKRSIGMGVVVVQEDEDDGNDDAAPGVTSSRRDNPINNSLVMMPPPSPTAKAPNHPPPPPPPPPPEDDGKETATTATSNAPQNLPISAGRGGGDERRRASSLTFISKGPSTGSCCYLLTTL